MRKLLRNFALTTVITLPFTAPHPLAYAQASTTDPTIAAARARFSEGVDFYDKGQFENARAAFLQAYALHKHPAVLINLAQSSLRSGHALEADRYFTRYIHDSPALTPAQRGEAEKGLFEARAKLGRIDVAAPAGAPVTIDGELASSDGSTITDVEPGLHSVRGAGETTTVNVSAGQTVSVKLGKAPAAAPAPEPIAVPTPAPATTEPSTDTRQPAQSPAANEGPGLLTPPDTMTPVWIGAGVGVAGFATAILFGVFKGNAQNSYNAEAAAIKQAVGANSQGACVSPKASAVAQGCAALSSDGNDVNTDATVANVGIVAGIVGVGVAAGWYLFAPKTAKPSTSSFHVGPLVGPQTGGLTVGGSF